MHSWQLFSFDLSSCAAQVFDLFSSISALIARGCASQSVLYLSVVPAATFRTLLFLFLSALTAEGCDAWKGRYFSFIPTATKGSFAALAVLKCVAAINLILWLWSF